MQKEIKFKAQQTSGDIYSSFIVAIFLAVIGIACAILGLVMKVNVTTYIGLAILVVAAIMAIRGSIILIKCKHNTVEFYDTYLILKSGVFNTKEIQQPITKISRVSMTQSLGGKIWNYGNIHIDFVGKNDFQLGSVKNPKALKDYIENLIASTDYEKVTQVIAD